MAGGDPMIIAVAVLLFPLLVILEIVKQYK